MIKIMYLYNRLKKNWIWTSIPHTFLFSGKAAQSYEFPAKEVIRLIHAMADVVNQ